MPTLRRILLRTGGSFVDSVKFAMRGFTARRGPGRGRIVCRRIFLELAMAGTRNAASFVAVLRYD
jgi:hypothetical protein